MSKYQNGVSLLELTIALGVILTIFSVIAASFAVNRANARFDGARSELMSVSTAASQLSRTGNIPGMTARRIAESRLIPEAMVQGIGVNTRLVHSMGGEFIVAGAPFPGLTGANGVSIRMTGLSEGRCEDAALTFSGRFDAVVIGGAAVKNRLLATPLVPTRAAAAAACAAAPDQLTFFLIP